MALGATGYTACIGPVRDASDSTLDFYAIDVEKSDATASYVYFERHFRLADVPRDLLDAPIADVVIFDEPTRTVEFVIGNRRERYVLPDVP